MLTVLAVLGGAGAARADSLDEGKRLYHELDYPAARKALLQAAEEADPHRRAESYLYLGLIDTISGQDAAAGQAFSFGLALDPGLELPLGTSPKVAKLFEDARAELARSGPRLPPPVRPATAGPPMVLAAEPVEPRPPRPHTGRWIAGAMVILGAVAAGTAIVFGVEEQAAERSFKSAKWQTDAVSAQSAANQDAVAADVLYAVGGAVGLSGAGLFFTF